jgi:hypothetical protein
MVEIITRYNSTYPKGGVSCFADSFVVAESSVLRMKFSGKNPALRVAAKRQAVKKLRIPQNTPQSLTAQTHI